MRRSSASPRSIELAELVEPLLDLACGQAVEPALQAQQLEPGLLRVEGGVLQRDADAEPHLAAARCATSKPATDGPPAGRREQRAQHPHGGRLPGAVRAEEAVDLAAVDVEVDAVDGGHVAEGPGEALGDDRGRSPVGRVVVMVLVVFLTVAQRCLHGSEPTDHCGQILAAMCGNLLGSDRSDGRNSSSGEGCDGRQRPDRTSPAAALAAADAPVLAGRGAHRASRHQRPHAAARRRPTPVTRLPGRRHARGRRRLPPRHRRPPAAAVARRRRGRRYRRRAADGRRRVDRRDRRHRAARAGQARAGPARPAAATGARGAQQHRVAAVGRGPDGRR